MNVTPTTDLTPLLGVPVDVTYRLDGQTRTHYVTVVPDELHHGATDSGRYGLKDGVRGCARYLIVNGQRSDDVSWFYWPYDGLTIQRASS